MDNCTFYGADGVYSSVQLPTNSFGVCNEIFGDPVPGKIKSLRSYVNGCAKVVAEHTVIKNPQDLTSADANRTPDSQPVPLEFLTNLHGLEIGGPSVLLKGYGMYTLPASIDNTVYAKETLWASHNTDKAYAFPGKTAPGNVYIDDAVSLGTFANETYDFVFASHVLEHLVNPLLALTQIRRVLKPHGFCILVLPYKELTFDRYRAVTPMSELVEHYVGGRREDDVMDHVDAIVKDYDFTRDVPMTTAQFIDRCKDHRKNRALHVHVFDFNLICQVLMYTGYRIKELQKWGMNQLVVGQLDN